MGETTGIQWTEKTWNPWQGCEKVSEGCDNCYMYRDKRRYGQNPEVVVRSKPPTFNAPLRWNREARAAGVIQRVFVASWADFFTKEADPWRAEAWDIIRRCPNLVFQILTKRHGRIAEHLPPDWGDGYPNVWLGVSAETHPWFQRRVRVLRDIPAHVRFVSYEPALGPIVERRPSPLGPAIHRVDGPSLEGIHWLIVGGESGPGARPFDVQWARDAIVLGKIYGTAIFVKQLGARPVARLFAPGEGCPAHKDCTSCLAPLVSLSEPRPLGGRLIHIRDSHGGEWDEWPGDIRVRDFPVPVVMPGLVPADQLVRPR